MNSLTGSIWPCASQEQENAFLPLQRGNVRIVHFIIKMCEHIIPVLTIDNSLSFSVGSIWIHDSFAQL